MNSALKTQRPAGGAEPRKGTMWNRVKQAAHMQTQPTECGPTSAARPVETLQLGDRMGAHVPSGSDST